MSKKEKKKKDKGIAGLVLFLFWLVFILLAVIFYFYFSDSFFSFIKGDSKKSEAATTTEEAVNKTIYEIDAYPEINQLISSYLDAIVRCDRETLVTFVDDKEEFDDMSKYEEKAKVIVGYENVCCYTVDGFADGDKIVYAVSNMVFSEVSGIECKPLNINCYYLIKSGDKYIIDNDISNPEITGYINKTNVNPDIQDLYKNVNHDLELCAQNDAAFAEVYQRIMENSQ